MQFARWVVFAAVLAAPLSAAQFQFSTLIRWGANNSTTELEIGNAPGSWAATDSISPHFSNSQDRVFQIDYTKATNTATVRLFSGQTASGPVDVASFQPAGGGAVGANATWTLPASSFFVQAAPEFSFSTITVSNLTLVTGTINNLFPLQTTPMNAAQFFGGGAGTVNAGGDVVFKGDASGNWRLQGLVSMSAIGAPSPDGLTFGISASAQDAAATVPEPLTSTLIGLGLVGIAFRARRNGGLGGSKTLAV